MLYRKAKWMPQYRRRYQPWRHTVRMTERRVPPVKLRARRVFPRPRWIWTTPATAANAKQAIKPRRLPVAERIRPELRRPHYRLPLTKFGKVRPKRILVRISVQREVPRRGRLVPLTAGRSIPRRRIYPLRVPLAEVYPRGRRIPLEAGRLPPVWGRRRRPQTVTVPPPLPQRWLRLFAMRGHALIRGPRRIVAQPPRAQYAPHRPIPLTDRKLFVYRARLRPAAPSRGELSTAVRRLYPLTARKFPVLPRRRIWLPIERQAPLRPHRLPLSAGKMRPLFRRRQLALSRLPAPPRYRWRLTPCGDERIIAPTRTAGGIICVPAQGIFLLAPISRAIYLLAPVEQRQWLLTPEKQGVNCDE